MSHSKDSKNDKKNNKQKSDKNNPKNQKKGIIERINDNNSNKKHR